MLKELSIQNFALITNLQLSFSEGFSVLTGETGAGKSIIIDALSLLLGARASTEMIRTSCDKAIVEGSFDLTNGITHLLEQWGIEPEDELIISREIHVNGRNKCRINSRLVTVNQLSLLAPLLVDILGQHDHQSLLDLNSHLKILDSFADKSHLNLIKQVDSYAVEHKKIRNHYQQLKTNDRERMRQIDLLEFQINEIESAGLEIGEEAALEAERTRLAYAEKIRTTIYSVCSGMIESHDESGYSLLDQLSQLISELEAIASFDSKIASISSSFLEIAVDLQEGVRDLRDFGEMYESDPKRLEEVEDRLRIIKDLQRKYGETVEEILSYLEKCKKELSELSRNTEILAELEQKEHKLFTVWSESAEELSVKRKSCAKFLEHSVKKELEDLNMQNTRFSVEFKNQITEVRSKGFDNVEFKISPNLGESLKPLNKIASGGEMSRIMLALKSIIVKTELVPTLVFDEVDSGIGGRTAQKIAEKLKQLSKKSQVLLVTHLPVVASNANKHYSITKKIVDDRTFVDVRLLNEKERVEEIVRMLGGNSEEETTIEHAKDLLSKASTR